MRDPGLYLRCDGRFLRDQFAVTPRSVGISARSIRLNREPRLQPASRGPGRPTKRPTSYLLACPITEDKEGYNRWGKSQPGKYWTSRIILQSRENVNWGFSQFGSRQKSCSPIQYLLISRVQLCYRDDLQKDGWCFAAQMVNHEVLNRHCEESVALSSAR